MNQDKFSELVLYIAQESADDPYFGATKLDKILYYSDFNAYRRLGQSITGADYYRHRDGPIPTIFPVIRDALVENGDARIEERPYFNGTQKRVVPLRGPDLSTFSPDEIEIVDEVIGELWLKNAREVSDLSHLEFGWLTTPDRELISYRTAWIGADPLTAEQIEACLVLAGQRDAVGAS
jgi:hypothetical protein